MPISFSRWLAYAIDHIDEANAVVLAAERVIDVAYADPFPVNVKPVRAELNPLLDAASTMLADIPIGETFAAEHPYSEQQGIDALTLALSTHRGDTATFAAPNPERWKKIFALIKQLLPVILPLFTDEATT